MGTATTTVHFTIRSSIKAKKDIIPSCYTKAAKGDYTFRDVLFSINSVNRNQKD